MNSNDNKETKYSGISSNGHRYKRRTKHRVGENHRSKENTNRKKTVTYKKPLYDRLKAKAKKLLEKKRTREMSLLIVIVFVLVFAVPIVIGVLDAINKFFTGGI